MGGAILDLVYPVGSLYYNKTDVTTMINSTFPGKWERKGVIRVICEIPKHKHGITINRGSGNQSWSGAGGYANVDGVSIGSAATWDNSRDSILGDKPHNNMPPYKTYYCWERVS